MNYTMQKILARDKDETKFIQFAEWVAENNERMGVPMTDDIHIDGSYEMSYQDKTSSYIIELNTANEEFANDAKNKLEELNVSEVKMFGIVKMIGE